MAQKNTLKDIVLGLLNEQSLSGYDIAKAFDSDIGEFWNANHSQIYPLLKKLEENGLISHQISITGEKLEKKLYSLTKTGHQEFENWLSSPTPALSSSKDEFILKLYFIRQTTDPRIAPMILEQLALHQEKLTHLQVQMRTKFSHHEQQTQFGHYLILQHALNREQGYIDWLNTTLEELNGNK